MKLTRSARCHIRMDSKWVYASAICMGVSFFIRTAYYFGLVNLRDLDIISLIAEVILPMIIAAGYLIMIKGLRINSPALFGGLICVYSINYLLLTELNASGVFGGVLLITVAGIFLVTGLGFISVRMPILVAAGILALFRLLVIDIIGYLLPIDQFSLLTYLPESSNLFGLMAVTLLAPALHVTPLTNGSAKRDEHVSLS